MSRPRTPFRYEPSGDSDGFTAGIDHFVTDAEGREIACAPDEATARLLAASGDLLAALQAAPVVRIGETIDDFRRRYSEWYRETKNTAIRKATDVWGDVTS